MKHPIIREGSRAYLVRNVLACRRPPQAGVQGPGKGYPDYPYVVAASLLTTASPTPLALPGF